MSTKTIEQKIVGFRIVDPEAAQEAPAAPEPESMHEKVNRPEQLHGATYKIKPPLSEHALYITIN
ncbi:MAG: NrdJb, partial [Cellvibrionaceae bacterium]|nr:NrdJb [Cellvibrionaceae bacterium]